MVIRMEHSDPGQIALRDEAQSVISHITIDGTVDNNIVSKYSDAAKVPGWAKMFTLKHCLMVFT